MIPGLNILPCRANWDSPVTVGASFATNITREAAPGLFSRDAGRDLGQRKIKFSLMPYNDARRQWDAFREVNPPGTIIGVPMWCDEGITLAADVNAGATALVVADTDFVDWRGEGVLWHQPDPSTPPTIEGITINSAGDGGIGLSSALEGAFKASDLVLPMMRGFQIADYSEECSSPELSRVELEFVEDLAAISGANISGLPSALTYLGLPVLPLIAEWSEPPKIDIGKATHIAASGMNRQALATLRAYVRQRITHKVGLDGRQDRALLTQFFLDRRGRFSRFWSPALKDELKLSADVSPRDTTLQLANYADFVSRYQLGGDLRQAIFITDGFNFWIRQVSNLSGGSNRITIDAAIGTQALSRSSTRVGLLSLVQFATDDIEIECQAPVVATANLTFTELEHEYAEVMTTGTTNGRRQGMELQRA